MAIVVLFDVVEHQDIRMKIAAPESHGSKGFFDRIVRRSKDVCVRLLFLPWLILICCDQLAISSKVIWTRIWFPLKALQVRGSNLVLVSRDPVIGLRCITCD